MRSLIGECVGAWRGAGGGAGGVRIAHAWSAPQPLSPPPHHRPHESACSGRGGRGSLCVLGRGVGQRAWAALSICMRPATATAQVAPSSLMDAHGMAWRAAGAAHAACGRGGGLRFDPFRHARLHAGSHAARRSMRTCPTNDAAGAHRHVHIKLGEEKNSAGSGRRRLFVRHGARQGAAHGGVRVVVCHAFSGWLWLVLGVRARTPCDWRAMRLACTPCSMLAQAASGPWHAAHTWIMA